MKKAYDNNFTQAFIEASKPDKGTYLPDQLVSPTQKESLLKFLAEAQEYEAKVQQLEASLAKAPASMFGSALGAGLPSTGGAVGGSVYHYYHHPEPLTSTVTSTGGTPWPNDNAVVDVFSVDVQASAHTPLVIHLPLLSQVQSHVVDNWLRKQGIPALVFVGGVKSPVFAQLPLGPVPAPSASANLSEL